MLGEISQIEDALRIYSREAIAYNRYEGGDTIGTSIIALR